MTQMIHIHICICKELGIFAIIVYDQTHETKMHFFPLWTRKLYDWHVTWRVIENHGCPKCFIPPSRVVIDTDSNLVWFPHLDRHLPKYQLWTWKTCQMNRNIHSWPSMYCPVLLISNEAQLDDSCKTGSCRASCKLENKSRPCPSAKVTEWRSPSSLFLFSLSPAPAPFFTPPFYFLSMVLRSLHQQLSPQNCIFKSKSRTCSAIYWIDVEVDPKSSLTKLYLIRFIEFTDNIKRKMLYDFPGQFVLVIPCLIWQADFMQNPKFNSWMHNFSWCRGFAVIAKMTNMREILTDFKYAYKQNTTFLDLKDNVKILGAMFIVQPIPRS